MMMTQYLKTILDVAKPRSLKRTEVIRPDHEIYLWPSPTTPNNHRL